MKVCSHCFSDKYISDAIRSNAQMGLCSICPRSDFVIDTQNPGPLVDMFADLFSHVRIARPNENGFSSAYLLRDYFKVFSSAVSVFDIISFLHDLFAHDPDNLSKVSSKLVFTAFDSPKWVKENSIIQKGDWNDFCESIKKENRFWNERFNPFIFNLFLSSLSHPLAEDSLFYHARLSKKDHVFNSEELGAPSWEYSRDGRISARGLFCLYLADTPDTAACEIRSHKNDYIDMGIFLVSRQATFVDFRELTKISPFSTQSLDALIVNKKTFEGIYSTFAMPVTASDDPIDYIPCQFICDQIRANQDVSGLLYPSTVSDGYNLGVLKKDAANFTKQVRFRVRGVKMDLEPISTP